MNFDELRQDIFDSVTQAFLIVGKVNPTIFLQFANGYSELIPFISMEKTLQEVKDKISENGTAEVFFLTMSVFVENEEKIFITESRKTGELYTHVFDINGRVLVLNKEKTEEYTKMMDKGEDSGFPFSKFFGVN